MTTQPAITDFREQPRYLVAEAAHYLNVPVSTVRYWSVGKPVSPSEPEGESCAPLIEVPEPDVKPTLLSFIKLVELHVVAAIRRRHEVKMPNLRSAVDYLREHASDPVERRHPLVGRELETDGLDLFVERYGRLVNVSRAGQVVIREMLGAALERLERDTDGLPIRLYPFTRSTVGQTPSIIVIDPRLSAGRPVISGTGLATEIIAERPHMDDGAGESVDELAADYEREEKKIEEAIRCELRVAA